MIARGNTCFFAYPIPIFESAIKALYVTYVQHDEVVLEKTLDDVDFSYLLTEDLHVLVTMTQADTLKFKETKITSKDYVEVQIRIRTEDGEAYDSQILIERVQKALKGGVI